MQGLDSNTLFVISQNNCDVIGIIIIKGTFIRGEVEGGGGSGVGGEGVGE